MTIEITNRRLATLVPEDRRETFLPDLFGLPFLIVGENTVYNFMKLLSPYDYRGGFWNFYEHDGEPLFLAPATEGRFRIESGMTDFRGEVSAEAAGIIASLFALSTLSMEYRSQHLADGYHRLLAYTKEHPEGAAISAAID